MTNAKKGLVDHVMALRMNAESVLKDKIRRKESELNALQILKRVIPWGDLCDEDEAKLWSYFCRSDTYKFKKIKKSARK